MGVRGFEGFARYEDAGGGVGWRAVKEQENKTFSDENEQL